MEKDSLAINKKKVKNSLFAVNTILFFILISSFCFVIFSCGTDIYYSLEMPTLVSAPSTDPASRFFCFYTNDYQNRNLDVFTGTAVYYKIYDNLSNLNSDISSISSSNTEYSSNGMNRILALGYQPLTSTGSTGEPLFSVDSQSRKIRIRLFSEGDGYLYTEGIYINDSQSSSGKPCRFDNTHSFDFLNESMIPSSTDIDVKSSGTSSIKTWYVNAYAVSVGRDQYLANLYSQLLHLGYVIISVE